MENENGRPATACEEEWCVDANDPEIRLDPGKRRFTDSSRTASAERSTPAYFARDWSPRLFCPECFLTVSFWVPAWETFLRD
jgi:hypothetical protein